MRLYVLLVRNNEGTVAARATYTQADMEDAGEVWVSMIEDLRADIRDPLPLRHVYPVAFSVAVLSIPDTDLPREPR